MSVSCVCTMPSSSFSRRLAVIACVVTGFLGAPVASYAQNATIIGSLANFDVVNDTEGEKEGFEIQLEGINSADITRVFGQSASQCYIRYCIGSITDVPAGVDPVTGLSRPAYVSVKWTANYNAVTKTFSTHGVAGTSSGTPSTVGVAQPTLATGESCWTLGVGAAYPTSGCEHFGVSTAAGKNPTQTTYHWLVGDPATGNLAAVVATPTGVPLLVNNAPVPAPPVVIPHPVVAVIPPALPGGAAEVQVQVQAPAPFAPGAPIPHRYGKAQWVKVYKSELDRDAALDDLQFRNPGVPDANNVIAETEWKLLQFDVTNAAKGGSQLQSHGSPGASSHAVVRRYEFYKYAGPVVAAGGTSRSKGGAVLSTDDQEASLCLRATPGDLTTECVAPGPGEVGDFIGAQMAAQNLGNLTTPVISWPTPAPIVYGTALSTAQLNATATAVGAPVAGTFTYTPSGGTFLPAGVRTLQVLFTPSDPATFSTQTMTMPITVEKAPLTVVADHQRKVYGSLDPTLTFVASGIQAATGDTAATVLSGALDRAIGSNIGSYAIIQGTLAATSDYTLAFTASTLDITPAPLSIVANNATKTYGLTTTFAGTEFTVSGLTGADSVGSVSLASGGSAATAAAGSYDIVPSAAVGTGLSNYTIGYANGTLTVTPAALTVTANSASKIYGGTFSATFSTSGLLNTDAVASVTLTSAGAPTTAAVGSYAIVPSAAVGTGLTNYTIGYANGTLTVTPATLSVVANHQTKVAGAVDSPLTFVATGFQAGDTAAVLKGALARVAGEAPGTYAITQGTLAAIPNYTIAFTGDTLVITAAPPPPPPGISIAPIPDQSNTEQDEVELQVVVVGAGRTLTSGGVFSATGLPNGLRIDKEGEISGHIKKGTAGSYHVAVTFTSNGVTVSQGFMWNIVPAGPREGDKDPR
jgi:MBG domain-containing protein